MSSWPSLIHFHDGEVRHFVNVLCELDEICQVTLGSHGQSVDGVLAQLDRTSPVDLSCV